MQSHTHIQKLTFAVAYPPTIPVCLPVLAAMSMSLSNVIYWLPEYEASYNLQVRCAMGIMGQHSPVVTAMDALMSI